MKTLGNLIWFLFGGWYIALTWIVGGILFALSIIGIPLFRSAIEMAKLSAFPFGKEVVDADKITEKSSSVIMSVLVTLVNIIWLLTFGITLFFGYLFAGILMCIFIITIPFGLQAFKLATLALWPVGKRVISSKNK